MQWHSGDRVVSSLWGAASIRKFYRVGTNVELPSLTSHALSLALDTSHSDAPQLEYYGSGLLFDDLAVK